MTTLILVSLVGISITQAGKLAIATGEAGFSTMTRLIANNAAGGIRWNKPDAIESAYIEFATADDSVIATVVALDKDGNEIGRAHVRTPVTNAQTVCRHRLEKKKK